MGVFNYISGNIQYPEIKASSKPVTMATPKMPQGAHLALGPDSDPTSMRVYWSAGALQTPGVMYAAMPLDPDMKWDSCARAGKCLYVAGAADAGRQYTADDMCDRNVQPAGRQGYVAPGKLLSATMTGLKPGASYAYVYGDEATGWSVQNTFKAAPAPDANRVTTIAAFGDMGQAEADGAWHHSWDFDDRGEVPSRNTTKRLLQDSDSELVLHI